MTLPLSNILGLLAFVLIAAGLGALAFYSVRNERRADAALRVTPESHPWQGPELCVHDKVSETPIGDFLNREESLELLAVLRKELPVRTHSNASAIDA